MKKKFFLIGALMAMSMSAMFVACSGKNEASEAGCICTIVTYDGETISESASLREYQLRYPEATTCSDLTLILKRMNPDAMSVDCRNK